MAGRSRDCPARAGEVGLRRGGEGHRARPALAGDGSRRHASSAFPATSARKRPCGSCHQRPLTHPRGSGRGRWPQAHQPAAVSLALATRMPWPQDAAPTRRCSSTPAAASRRGPAQQRRGHVTARMASSAPRRSRAAPWPASPSEVLTERVPELQRVRPPTNDELRRARAVFAVNAVRGARPGRPTWMVNPWPQRRGRHGGSPRPAPCRPETESH